MESRYNDDDMIKVPFHDVSDSFERGKTTATIFNKKDAPLTETSFTVLIQLTGSKETANRAGLDLVLLLDMSMSMGNDDRMKQLKTASKFLIKKLSPIDRLSVIKFSDKAKRLCPLRQMDEAAQCKIIRLINDLKPGKAANMTEALEMAVKVVNDRKFTEGREVAIMFVSDGGPNPEDKDGSQINIEDVPVYTFGLGEECYRYYTLLSNIAGRSKFATFSTAGVGNDETSNLAVAFSQCLAGLQTVVAQDLTLTIKPQRRHSRTVKVGSDHSYGRYPAPEDESDGSITVSFGSLYSKEMRNILVDLTLPDVNDSKEVEILKCTYSYKEPRTQKVVEPPAIRVEIYRKRTASPEENLEVSLEKARRQTVAMMKQAMEEADNRDLKKAKATVREAKKDLKNNNRVVSNPNIKALISELSQFSKYLSPESYERLGRAFVLPALLSHKLQRFASKGNADEHRLFATDAMKLLLDQVHKYENDPASYKVPTPDQDREELKSDNLVAAVKALSLHVKAMEDIIKDVSTYTLINYHA